MFVAGRPDSVRFTPGALADVVAFLDVPSPLSGGFLVVSGSLSGW